MPTAPVVLVVEDHMELRNVLLDALDWEGYDTVAANDTAEASAVLRRRRIDLLVSDPPPFDGEQEALDALEGEFPDLPIVALEDENAGGGIYFGPWAKVGNRRTLRRPFRLHDLLAACRDAVPVPEPEEEEDEEEKD